MLRMQQLNNTIADTKTGSLFRVDLDFQSRPSAQLQVSLRPIFVGETGYVQSDLLDNQVGRAELLFQEAALHWRWSPYFSSSLGILSLEQWLSPLVGSPLGQTGLGIFYDSRTFQTSESKTPSHENNSSSLHFRLGAMTTVPNSFQQNYNAQERRESPRIDIVSVQLFQAQTPSFKWLLSSSYLQGFQLPESMAEQGNFKGNTVAFAIDGRRTSFIYQYRLTETALDLSFIYSRFSLGAELIYIRNFAAPSRLNQAWSWAPRIMVPLKGNESLTFRYHLFYVEPDAVIASFNMPFIESNRYGQQVIVTYQLNQMYRLSFLFRERKALFRQPFQPHEISSLIQWEVDYEFL
ncbi:MAG: hypothetical protein NZ480_03845 [Bdellovibrionaceae bacterium]|nr:hypothetical protein [Pseudobdellovibrionaceae bacterium]MDW8190044.1 hypothetical protein [Pseudobdellovibrionaceae bacterium]